MITLLLSALILLAIVGLILWGVGQIPGIPGVVKTVIYIVVGVVLLLLVLQAVQHDTFHLLN
jgi:hypothetical protein